MEKTHKIDVVSIRLVEEPPLYSSKELKNPCDVAELFQDFLKDCDREMFCILNLRTKNQVINVNVVGMGTLNSVLFSFDYLHFIIFQNCTPNGRQIENPLISKNHKRKRGSDSSSDCTLIIEGADTS